MAGPASVLLLAPRELAGDLLGRLVRERSDRRVFVVTVAEGGSEEDCFDPHAASAARELAQILSEVRPDVVGVFGFSESASRPARPWLHDGALADAVCGALDRAYDSARALPALVMLSSTSVYGVAAASPLVFDERSPLPSDEAPASAHARWAEGLRQAERRLAAKTSGAKRPLTVLRAASVLAGPLDSPIACLLRARMAARVLGFDPPCQLLHYDDLLDALALALDQPCGETLNLVGRSVASLSRLLAGAGVFAPALPEVVAARLAPAGFDVDRLRWRCLADGRRAAQLLGFRPRRTFEDCLRARR